MNSLTGLREVVDVVIGVDTHSAAVVDAATGGVLDEIAVDTTTQGYAELVESPTTTRCYERGRSRRPVVTAPN